MKELIAKAKKIIIAYDNHEYSIKYIKDSLVSLLEGSYFSPSYVTIRTQNIDTIRSKGLWIEIFFHNEKTYKDYTFSKILFQLKPNYNFITMIRGNEDYSGKCININLATNTTQLYEEILDNLKG